ncbi:hypothetical protein D8674_010668 [Pyrus ussuriensis x Pyrus communis]|uniref:Uncharacterized protein n=1 Tax=Pyrus ussuriensis x Pyrus communis TaxID=2448454 RepID=A0A5N5FBP7_9ROSA|nr:hypothetical protein D8674_010668 [Pyrus ussuriensis x Pyrus communis]
MCFSNQRPLQPLPNTYSPQESFDTTLEDTLKLLAQNNFQFQQSTSSIIQNHYLALTKLEIQVGQIVQAINEHQSDGDDQEEKEEQPKEALCAYFHSEVLAFYEDDEPYTPPKPYVPPIRFPGRFVKQKHDEPPIYVLEEIVPDIVFEALPQSSNPIEWFSKSMSDSPRCFKSFQVPYLESLEDDLLPFQDEKELKLDNETFLPSQTKEEDMVSHCIHKERRKRHHNQGLVEIQHTIFKVP